jgi:hypothetical protein
MRLNKPFYALVDPKTNSIVWHYDGPIIGQTKADVKREYDRVLQMGYKNLIGGRDWLTYEIRKVKVIES